MSIVQPRLVGEHLPVLLGGGLHIASIRSKFPHVSCVMCNVSCPLYGTLSSVINMAQACCPRIPAHISVGWGWSDASLTSSLHTLHLNSLTLFAAVLLLLNSSQHLTSPSSFLYLLSLLVKEKWRTVRDRICLTFFKVNLPRKKTRYLWRMNE